ncbi:helix-turn-helix domain-containing protein [Gordonia neofelifaecis]|uniref:HTH cro/C1-type domain-containing protein n=1 Tax=Gordonia neofelifaecis NRRL B-59395 TaxID=644548 RepID=F1YKZ1_9ACTN|nr:helix-turn-helix transcriptional regulator [Gordonia neofelifaecis]EGD54785.1 hypothetical protein SCNU_12892 [Gordonia neofelifaecis NRRL B-59395]
MARAILPEPWNSALVEAGFVDSYGAASLQPLADEVSVHPSTLSRAIRGLNVRPSGAVVKSLSNALGLPMSTIAEWISAAYSEEGLGAPYLAPRGSETLTQIQRNSVTSIINAFIDQNARTRRPSMNSMEVAIFARELGVSRGRVVEAMDVVQQQTER